LRVPAHVAAADHAKPAVLAMGATLGT